MGMYDNFVCEEGAPWHPVCVCGSPIKSMQTKCGPCDLCKITLRADGTVVAEYPWHESTGVVTYDEDCTFDVYDDCKSEACAKPVQCEHKDMKWTRIDGTWNEWRLFFRDGVFHKAKRLSPEGVE